MTVREIQGHLEDLYGVEVSPDLISRVTSAVMDDVVAWQNRPLDAVYPIVYLDALVVKVRDQGVVRNKSVYLALGVTMHGSKEVLGLWIEQNEGAKFWLKVVNELKTRGVRDILIACCDGLKGFPEAIETAFPQTVVQTCIVHYAELRVMPIRGWRPPQDRWSWRFEVGIIRPDLIDAPLSTSERRASNGRSFAGPGDRAAEAVCVRVRGRACACRLHAQLGRLAAQADGARQPVARGERPRPEAVVGDGGGALLGRSSCRRLHEPHLVERARAPARVSARARRRAARGRTAKVPMIHLLREASIQRSPRGTFAVLSQIETCGDLCHSMHFILDENQNARDRHVTSAYPVPPTLAKRAEPPGPHVGSPAACSIDSRMVTTIID
jgi:hypothetical protein